MEAKNGAFLADGERNPQSRTGRPRAFPTPACAALAIYVVTGVSKIAAGSRRNGSRQQGKLAVSMRHRVRAFSGSQISDPE